MGETISNEMDSLFKNHTQDLAPRLQGKNGVKCLWVYKTKFTFEGVVECHKAHLVVKGFSQQEEIDYNETFSLVEKMNYVRLTLSLDVCFKWKIHQMDVKSAFSHGDLYEVIYIEQPPSFMIDSTLAYQLQNLLQGLKQAHRAWYAKIDNFFISLGFKHCEYDHSLYVLHVHGNTLIVFVYVDDLVITGNNL